MFLAMAELGDAFDPKSYPGLFSELIPPDREAALATMMRENIRPATVRAAGYIGAGDFLRSELGELCLAAADVGIQRVQRFERSDHRGVVDTTVVAGQAGSVGVEVAVVGEYDTHNSASGSSALRGSEALRYEVHPARQTRPRLRRFLSGHVS
jgi:hypothetical protein